MWQRIRELPTWLKILLLGRFVDSAGSMAGFFMTLYLVTHRHLAPDVAGLVVAAAGAASITGNLVGGWFGDRFGLRRSVIAAQLVGALSTAAIPFVPVAGIVVFVVLGGLIGGASRPLMSALVAVSMAGERRRESIAFWRTASNAGVMIGPPLGALLSAHSFGALFEIDAAAGLVMLAIVIRRMPADVHIARASGSLVRLWPAVRRDRTFAAVLATVIVVDTVYRLQYSILPLHLAAVHQPTIVYGSLIAVNGALIVAGEAAIAVRLRGHSAVRVIAGGFALVGAGYAVFLGPSAGWLGIVVAAVAMTVITCGEMLYKPTATAYATDAAPAGLEGRYQSLYGGASIAGTILTPSIGGWAYVHVPSLIWPVAAVFALGAAGTLRLRTRPAADVDPLAEDVMPLAEPAR
jgi:MFS family permease